MSKGGKNPGLKPSRVEYSRVEQSRVEQSKAEQSGVEQSPPKGGSGGNPSLTPNSILDFFNTKAKTAFKLNPETREQISSLIAEGWTRKDFECAILGRVSDWRNDEKMSKWLRPQTVFKADKFADYVATGQQAWEREQYVF